MDETQTRVIGNLTYLIRKSLREARFASEGICDFGPDNKAYASNAERELRVAKEFINIAKRIDYFPKKELRVLSFDYHDALEEFIVEKNIYEDMLLGIF